jgi:pimeloyl-ACP methyl ester carboxylesterase
VLDEAVRDAGRGSSGSRGSSAESDWRRIDWRAHRRWISSEERQIKVVELGDGPPLVFVHGLGGCWQNWLRNIPAAARHHRVIALDLPGFGASQMPRDAISIPGYAGTITALCHALGIATATVVGNSMGGLIAAELAISHPTFVQRLVLVDAAGLSTERLHVRSLSALDRAARAVRLSRAVSAPSVAKRPGLRRLALRMVAHHPERLSADLSHAILQGTGKEGFIPALACLPKASIRGRLPEIRCPTLIIWGQQDRLVPLADADDIRRLIPNSQLVVFPDVGHVPMLEEPERFNAELAAFTSPNALTPAHPDDP